MNLNIKIFKKLIFIIIIVILMQNCDFISVTMQITEIFNIVSSVKFNDLTIIFWFPFCSLAGTNVHAAARAFRNLIFSSYQNQVKKKSNK